MLPAIHLTDTANLSDHFEFDRYFKKFCPIFFYMDQRKIKIFS